MARGTPFERSYTWTKSVLQSRGLLTKAPKRSVHRKTRMPRPLLGMAASSILSIFLVEEEGTALTFQGLHEVIRPHGLFSSFYTDRGSHYS